MRELRQVLDAASRALVSGEPGALATVLAVEGSSFRRPGARLWIGKDARAGSVSAGCLENDLAERASRFRAAGAGAILVSYDTATEADVLWGTASGCGGRLDVLLEPVTRGLLDDLAWIARETGMRRRCVLLTVWNGSRVERHRLAEGQQSSEPWVEVASATIRDGRNRVFREGEHITLVEAAIPAIDLTVVGGGEDAVAVARQAAALGWTTRLVDRSRKVDAEPGVTVAHEELETLGLSYDERSAVVLMTHNFHRDAELLEWLQRHHVGYLGVLGPKRRTEELLARIGASAAAFPSLHAPPGLDLGAETPAEIALSIVSEVNAVFSGRGGGRLSEVQGPIHDRVESIKREPSPLLPR